MENVTGFIMSVISLIINLLSLIVSFYILIYLIWKVYLLRQINTFLTMMSYVSIVICNSFNICLNIQTILGDTKRFIVSDSTTCHIIGHMYLLVGINLLDSFSIQSFIRMLSIVYPTRRFLRSLKSIIGFTLIIWLTAVLRLLPVVFLKIITYQQADYICVLNLHMWIGNVYTSLTVYYITIFLVILFYVQVIRFSRKIALHNRIHRRRKVTRNAHVLRRIVQIVNILLILGLPSAVFWIIDMITGELHYLTYRIQALFLALGMFIATFAVVLTNSKIKYILPFLNRQHLARVAPLELQQNTINRSSIVP